MGMFSDGKFSDVTFSYETFCIENRSFPVPDKKNHQGR